MMACIMGISTITILLPSIYNFRGLVFRFTLYLFIKSKPIIICDGKALSSLITKSCVYILPPIVKVSLVFPEVNISSPLALRITLFVGIMCFFLSLSTTSRDTRDTPAPVSIKANTLSFSI